MFGKAKTPSGKLGIYIHIPFCRSKCDYCDFYSLAGQEAQMAPYQKALLAHLKESVRLPLPPKCWDQRHAPPLPGPPVSF